MKKKTVQTQKGKMHEGAVFIFTDGKLQPMPIWNMEKLLASQRTALIEEITEQIEGMAELTKSVVPFKGQKYQNRTYIDVLSYLAALAERKEKE